tara:strand:- start:784 stop:1161 length:378 start_codon:yes stop_codon:yes gene_type:complete
MANKKVIIVEDDFIIQMFLEELLLSNGCDLVGIASTGDEALEMISENQLDLIFMDIGISGDKNGIEVASMINESSKTPIVFLTGNSDKLTLEEANATGPLHIMYKPIDEISFLAQFNIVCDKLNS